VTRVYADAHGPDPVLGFLLLVGAAAAAVTTYLAQEADDLGRANQATAARVDRLLVAVGTIGDALQAYIVPAGADRPTAAQAPMLIADFAGEINETTRAVRSLRSGDILKTLGDQARSLGEIEAKAQEHVRLGQDLMASDVIAAEARPVLATMTSSLTDLRAVETSTLDAARADRMRKAWSVVAGAAVVWTLGSVCSSSSHALGRLRMRQRSSRPSCRCRRLRHSRSQLLPKRPIW
jgi:hypothetical protein